MNLPKTGCEKLDQYCEGVKSGNIDVCRWVRLAVDRHYRDLSRQHDKDYPYYFDKGACEHYVYTFESEFSHYEGAVAGEPVVFPPWKWFAFGSIFGWLKKKPFKGHHIRRFRKAYIIVPKKNAKSFISGGTAIYMMDYDGWPGAQCYIMARSVKHAKDLGYRAATSFVENNTELSSKYRINRSAADAGIYYQENNNAFYKPITAKVEGEDGRNVHFFGPDETKDWTAPSAIYDLMASGTVNAPNSLIMGTTTAGPNEDSLGKEHQDYIEEVLQGIVEDDATFGVIFGIDAEDKYKRDDSGEIIRDENNSPVEDEFYYERPELWAKANPNYELSVFKSALEELLPAARKSITKRIEFKTKHLNEWHASVSSFIKPEKWNACDLETIPPLFKGFTSIAGVSLADRERRINEIYERLFERFRGCKAWAGLDLGSVDDFSAYVMAIQNENDTLDVVPMFWIPSETMKERKNENKLWPWIEQGYIQLTPGPTTDHNFIEYCIRKTAEYVDLQHIMYDRAKADAIRNNLEDAGYSVVDHGQGYLDMNPAVDAMEKLILERRVNLGGNPIMKWMNNNTVIRMDPAGNRKFDKDKSADKIDGMVAAAMSISQAYLQIPESGSIYDEDPEIASI